MTQEEWRAIFDLNHDISNHGRVRLRKNPDRTLKLWQDKDGYLGVTLYKKGGTQRLYRVHRLVAEAFIPNIMNKPFINHIDFDRANNNVKNLEWCTAAENSKHSVNNKRFAVGELHHSAKLTESSVKYIRAVWLPGSRDFGNGALSRRFGVSPAHVSRIARGLAWKHLLDSDSDLLE